MDTTSVLDTFRIGIGLSSPRIVGSMNTRKSPIDWPESSGLLTATSHTVVDLYGSLSLADKGHATDAAIIMGLARNSLQDIVIDGIPAFIELMTYSRRLSVTPSAHIVNFPVAKNTILHPEMLPRHESGMRVITWRGQEELLGETHYSVGGELIVEEEHFGLSYDVETPVPYDFHSTGELLRTCDYNGLSTSGLVMHNELALRSKAETDVGFARIWQVMRGGIERGMNTEGILPSPLDMPRRVATLRHQLVSSDNTPNDPMSVIDWINMYALAVNEENIAGKCVITAPTNSACGAIPAVLTYYDKFRHPVNERSTARYLLATGAIGTLYKMSASISDAEVGCQGEIGVACSMVTARLTELLGGSPAQVCDVAGIAIGHNLGLTCDPTARQVQIPCIEHNAISTVKAVNAAQMAMRRISAPRVSLDKVIKIVYEVDKGMNDKYYETSHGGLAIKVVYG